MRNPNRIPEMIELISKVWERYPDLRLGQLIINAALPRDPCPQVFYIEDDVMKERLLSMLSPQWPNKEV